MAVERRWVRRLRWVVLEGVGVVLAFVGGYLAGYYYSTPPYPPRGRPRVWDYLIVGGTVIDGTGRPGRRADVGIARGRIVWVGRWQAGMEGSLRVRRVIDGTGRVVAPGFIDVHTHIEGDVPSEGPLRAPNFIGQGVTTVITGNCGRSFVDVAAFFRRLDRFGAQVNVATLVGHNSLREAVLRSPDRPAAPREVAAMKARLQAAMEAGAVGISTGLAYRPGVYATTEEVIELVRAVGPYGGIYATHIRDEGLGSRAALEEAVRVAEAAGVRLHVCHFKLSGRAQWGQAEERLQWLASLRRRGLHITLDAYPYRASSTTLEVLLPPELLRGGAFRRKPPQEVVRAIVDRAARNGWPDFSFAQIAYYEPDHSLEGLTIPEVAARMGVKNPGLGDVTAQAEVILRLLRRGGAQMVYQDMDEADVVRILRDPWTMVGSDSAVRVEGRGLPHPRGWGTFPRVLGEYVRTRRIWTWEEAVYRMTGLPAQTFCLSRRGRIAPGYWADVVVFRPSAIQDQATYRDPFRRPIGIDYVWVNGVLVLDRGRETGRFPGRPVRRDCADWRGG